MFKLLHWAKILGVAVTFLVALIIVGSSNVAAASCKKVDGKFTLTPVTGAACTSPVGICATGAYKGDLKGTSSFVGSSVIPTTDTPTTAVIVVTGDNVIQTKHGTLTTKDAIVLNTTGEGEFGEVDTVVSGAGEWAGFTGRITATGTFTAADGGEGSYAGKLCSL